MFVFTDRNFNAIAFADTKDIPLLEDELNDQLETGTVVLTLTIPKNHQDVAKVEVGNYIFASGYKTRTKPVAAEIMEIFETRHTKEIIAEDAGLDLLNDEAENIDMKGTLEEFILATIGPDSSWQIGINEIDKDKTMTLQYEGVATQTKRIAQIVSRFSGEVSYSLEMIGSTVVRKLINLHAKRGKNTGQRIEIGRELEGVRRHISITDLCTAVRPFGEPYQKTMKVVVPYNLLRNSNRESTTRNYKVGEWQLAEPIKEGEEVTITFKGVINPLQKFRIYNSGSNHSIGFLEKVSDGVYSARIKWIIGSEGNTSLWAYQYPDRGTNNDICKVEWAVVTKENEVASKWVPSRADESGEQIPSATNASETISVVNLDGDARIEKMVTWFKSREGKVGYNDGSKRFGPDYYDCSSSVLIAAKHAGLMPSSAPTRNTATMMGWGNEGTYFHQIASSQVKRGDIFVSRTSSSGHTGLFLDAGKTIIHTTVGAGKRGIMTTPAKGWLGTGTIKYFRFNVLRDTPTQSTIQTTKPVASGTYWTNSNIVHHDIGKTLEGITAQQLNNWIKAKSPSSPFNGQGAVFLEAQKQSGLDARIILAHAAHESAWGTSNIAKKLHNYFGINAYDSDPYNGAAKSANAGLKEGIINGAKWIASRYYNSSYKQTTLYKMRWNNGVHEYASDTKWDVKIANIAKGSEPFTKASTTVSGADGMGIVKSVQAVKYEDKTVDVELNLVGYEYDDGRYFVNAKGEICDRQGLEKWGRFKGYGNERTGYILRVYESKATTQPALFQEGLLQLQKNNEPRVAYEVDLSHLPDGVKQGDEVRLIDHEFQPPLYLDARVIDITESKSHPKDSKALFSNFVERESGISDKLIALQNLAKSLKWNWDNQPYVMNITSSLGNIFKDGLISTDLRANITRAGIDQTLTVDYFKWERVSKYQDKLRISDEAWNDQKLTVDTNVITIINDDVDLEATFTCSAILDGIVIAAEAYTIKDLSIGIFTQETEPDRSLLNWGDIWKWDDDTAPFKRVWKGDRWEDTVTKRDLELLELTPGPPGADGEDGMPGENGKDGRTSYVHFAYADSEDGSIGFTKTATTGKKYIGMYVDFTESDSDDPSDYAWSLFKGEDGTNGIPGKAGADGRTPYFHTAYANSFDGNVDFSTEDSTNKTYIGTYVDYVESDDTDPTKYKWIKIKGEDGKSGQLGMNLLKNSNVLIEGSTSYLVKTYQLTDSIAVGETVTATLKGNIADGRVVRLYKSDSITELGVLNKQENGLYTSTFKWKDGGAETQVLLYIGPNISSNPPVDIEWITLQRGTISAIDWVPNTEDLQDNINLKADQKDVADVATKQEVLEVHLQQTRESAGLTASELSELTLQREREKYYLDALKEAIDSDDVHTLRERLAIIEANVGAGKLSIQAITTYFDFAEEGLLIGKDGEQIKLRVVNDALEIIDGNKITARFANNFAETPNLKVPGMFEFAYHMAAPAIDPWGGDVTVIRAIRGSTL